MSSGELPKGKGNFKHSNGSVDDLCSWSWEGLAGGRTSREMMAVLSKKKLPYRGLVLRP